MGPDFPKLVSDYVLHLIEYGGFAVTLVWGRTSGFRKELSLQLSAVACLVASLYGATDEFHQAFIPGREASFQDLSMDVVGSAVSAFLVFRFRQGTR